MKIWPIFLLTLIQPAATFAATTASSNDNAASELGKVVGMALFAYLAMKFMNRKKTEGDDRPRGTSKILIGILGLIVLVAIFR